MKSGYGVPEALLARFSGLVASHLGLHFPRERWPDLERGIGSAAPDFGQADARACVERLMSSSLTRREIEILANHLTVGETYFFREKDSFAALEAHILPELLHRRRRDGEQRLRIWSAGCCTGEEPYSLAILLNCLLPDLDGWSLALLATDINPHFLHKAESGRYGEWSFRATPAWARERYFTQGADGRFAIDPGIRRRVTFSCLNLAEDVYPSLLNNTNAMDIIFCRNVLMYFTPERARGVVRNLHHCLVDGGWLVVSPSEASQALFADFATVNYPGAIFYRRDDRKHDRGDVDRHRQAAAPHARQSEALQVPFWPPLASGVPAPVIERAPQAPAAGRNAQESRPDPLEQARALYAQGRYPETATILQAALASTPDDIGVMTLLARTLANQGKLAEALAWGEKTVAAGKLNPAAHYLLAIILQEYGQFDKAVASLKRTLYLDPDFVLAHFALGNLVRQQGGHPESERHFQNALAILDRCPRDDRLPEAEGITAGRLRDIIRAAVPREVAA